MNGVSVEAQVWMVRDQRLFSAANNAMKKLAEDIPIKAQSVSGSTESDAFRLFNRAGSVVEARSEGESLRMIYDIITGNVTLSCVDTLAGRLKIKEVVSADRNFCKLPQ